MHFNRVCKRVEFTHTNLYSQLQSLFGLFTQTSRKYNNNLHSSHIDLIYSGQIEKKV